jgi:hypothetical protein
MHRLIRAATLALALQQAATVTATLAAQDNGGPAESTNPACALVTEKEVEAATGLDYGPGKYFGQEYETIEGAATCMWGGPGGFTREDRPEMHVIFIAASARGSHTEWRRKQRLRTGCTREPVRGVGDDGFVETCPDNILDASVYARTGNNDVLVRVYQTHGMSKASVEPVAIALAKAAASRAKGK